ncbi:MAG: phosphoribosylanthranilate isomerase [Crocinitomicaceae bacterium]
MLFKVCGITEQDQLDQISEFVDMTGMIFYPKSPRYLTNYFKGNEGNRVGVFVNENEETIRAIAHEHMLDVIQLHGSESPELCEALKADFKVIKAFGIDESFDFEVLNIYESIDHFLFDTQTKDHGGSGRQFNWQLLDKYTLNIPFLLSGGIGPEHILEIMNFSHPQFEGIDLNSKFEIQPGIKDIQKLKDFTNELRHNIHTA